MEKEPRRTGRRRPNAAPLREVVPVQEEFERSVGPELNESVNALQSSPVVKRINVSAAGIRGTIEGLPLPVQVWWLIGFVTVSLLTFGIIWGSVYLYVTWVQGR